MTDHSRERLRAKDGFSDTQANALTSVIEELAEVFVTKEYLRAELAELEQRMDQKTVYIDYSGSLQKAQMDNVED